MTRPVQVVAVFARDGAGGNPLGVVNDRSGLDAAAMQAIAIDLGFSETVFVDWFDATRPPRARIFTPARELPFAGHPLVGAAWVLSCLGPGPRRGELTCSAGDVPYRVEPDVAWIDTAGLPATVVAGDAPLIHAAGLPPPVAVVEVRLPSRYLLVRVGSPAAVAGARPRLEALGGVDGCYLYARDGDRVRARFFAPAMGVDEDPATGSALVALVHACRATGETSGSLVVDQGDETGRPSRLLCRWTPDRLEIGGEVVHTGVRLVG